MRQECQLGSGQPVSLSLGPQEPVHTGGHRTESSQGPPTQSPGRWSPGPAEGALSFRCINWDWSAENKETRPRRPLQTGSWQVYQASKLTYRLVSSSRWTRWSQHPPTGVVKVSMEDLPRVGNTHCPQGLNNTYPLDVSSLKMAPTMGGTHIQRTREG